MSILSSTNSGAKSVKLNAEFFIKRGYKPNFSGGSKDQISMDYEPYILYYKGNKNKYIRKHSVSNIYYISIFDNEKLKTLDINITNLSLIESWFDAKNEKEKFKLLKKIKKLL